MNPPNKDSGVNKKSDHGPHTPLQSHPERDTGHIERYSELPELTYRTSNGIKFRKIMIPIASLAAVGVSYLMFPLEFAKFRRNVLGKFQEYFSLETEQILNEGSEAGGVNDKPSECDRLIQLSIGAQASELKAKKVLHRVRSCLLLKRLYVRSSDLSNIARVTNTRSLRAPNPLESLDLIQTVVSFGFSWQGHRGLNLASAFCNSWQPSPGCLSRLLALQLLEKSVPRLPHGLSDKMLHAKNMKPFRGYLYWSEGISKLKIGSYREALKLFRMGLRLTDRDPGLKMILVDALAELRFLSNIGPSFEELRSKLSSVDQQSLNTRGVLDFFAILSDDQKFGHYESEKHLLTGYKGVLNRSRYLEYIFSEDISRRSKTFLGDLFEEVFKTLGKKFSLSHEVHQDLKIWQARYLFAAGRQVEAINLLKQIAKTQPNNFRVQHLLGVLKYSLRANRQSLKESALHLQKALKIQENWESYYALGVVLVANQQFNNVERVLQRINSLAKKDRSKKIAIWSQILKAELLLVQKKSKKSLALIRSLIRTEGELPILNILLSRALKASAHFKEHKSLQIKLSVSPTYQSKFFRLYGDPIGPLVFIR